MNIIRKIKEAAFKVKDYDRLERDYSCVLDYATGGVLSKTNYPLDSVYRAIHDHWKRRAEKASLMQDEIDLLTKNENI